MKKSKQIQHEESLAKWLLHKCNTRKWRVGECSQYVSYSVSTTQYDLREILGSSSLSREAEELEKEGYIEIEWGDVQTKIKRIVVDTERLDELYERERISNPRKTFEEKKHMVRKYQCEIAGKVTWLEVYYDGILSQLENAKKTLPRDVEDEALFQ